LPQHLLSLHFCFFSGLDRRFAIDVVRPISAVGADLGSC
jgi:hypothetical protein